MKLFLALTLLILLVSCGDTYRNEANHMITPQNAAMLMAEAIRAENELDVVFYPTVLINPNTYALLDGSNISDEEAFYLSLNFEDETKDQFLVGTMRGKDIKKFLISRTRGIFKKDLETAGLRYNINMTAGVMTSANFERDNNQELKDNEYYRVGVSNFGFFSGQTFPSYKFRDGMNFSFIPTGDMVSAKESLARYLQSTWFRALDLTILNGNYSEYVKSQNAGFKKTYEIQGRGHRSPYWAQKVTTRGIVTAVSTADWYPHGTDIIIQDPKGDGDDITSDGLNIHLESHNVDVKIGDTYEVTGYVFEREFESGLTKTVIRNVEKWTTQRPETIKLPKPVYIGVNGRNIPDRVLSTFVGDINFKPELKLTDGIDFWESLEGMRIEFDNPRVVGFRGGKENAENEAERPRGYLTLYVVADGNKEKSDRTSAGGLIENAMNFNFNPEIIMIVDNHLSGSNLDAKDVYNIGKTFEGKVEGVLSYEMNLFGDGGYSVVIPQRQETLTPTRKAGERRESTTRMSNRPRTALKGEDNHLTVGSFNLKNLSGNQPIRLRQIGEVIRVNMNCPDILSLVEIQDANGIAVFGGSGAEKTLERLIEKTSCLDTDYRYVNIDPFLNSEGGQPGGNIRVAMIYNAKRVGFKAWGTPSPLDSTFIRKDGSLSTNPGRVYARIDDFKNTRKSTVAEFTFRGEKVVVVGNHFPSKLGDSDDFGSIQPPIFKSELRRIPIAIRVNQFVREIEARDPKANIIVAGDFNAEFNEPSMLTLMGTELVNLMFVDSIVDAGDRYTHNYNGNSTAIDFIFANKNLMKKKPAMDVLHVNSDYMGRYSDHDPLVAQFIFE